MTKTKWEKQLALLKERGQDYTEPFATERIEHYDQIQFLRDHYRELCGILVQAIEGCGSNKSLAKVIERSIEQLRTTKNEYRKLYKGWTLHDLSISEHLNELYSGRIKILKAAKKELKKDPDRAFMPFRKKLLSEIRLPKY